MLNKITSLGRFFPVLYAAALTIYIFMGTLVRYLADDHCVAIKPHLYGGIIGTLIWDYNNWFGRFSESITSTAVIAAGSPWITLASPGILIFWTIGIFWMVYEVARLLHLASPIIAAMSITPLLLVSILAGSPQITQSIYWLNSIFTYAASVATAPFIIALFLRSLKSHWRSSILIGACLLIGVLSFFAAGFSEPYALVQVTGIALLFFTVIVQRKTFSNQSISLVVSAFSASIVAMIIILLAPGNIVRGNLFTGQPPLQALIESLIHAAAFIVASVLHFSLFATLGALLGTLFIVYWHTESVTLSYRTIKIGIGGILFITFLLIAAFMFPGFYASSNPPPARSYVIPQSIWILSLACIGALLGLALRKSSYKTTAIRRVSAFVCLSILMLGGLVMTWQAAALITPLKTYAEEYDERELLIQRLIADSEEQLLLKPFTFDFPSATGLEQISSDPNFWINRCAAQYYGVESIVVESNT